MSKYKVKSNISAVEVLDIEGISHEDWLILAEAPKGWHNHGLPQHLSEIRRKKSVVTQRLVRDITPLMDAKSVAVLGASDAGMSSYVLEQLRDWDFAGPVYPINPRRETLFGMQCYASLDELPEPPELVIIVLKAALVSGALEQAARVGAKAAVVVASGFGEVGEVGAALEREIAETADRLGIVMNGPNNYGVASLHSGRMFLCGPIPRTVAPGEIAIVFASGALTHCVEDAVAARGVGLSHVITVGNEAQIGFADYISYLADDPNVTVIACFVEGFRDPEGFENAVRLANDRGKRLLVLKTGRSESSRRAALAHTGALVGTDQAIDAWLKKCGAVRVKDLDELVETAVLLARYPDLGEGRVGIASISGGGSGVLGDLAGDTGLGLEPFSEAGTERLREVLPDYAAPNNPLDVTSFGQKDPVLGGILRTMCEDPELDLVGWAFHTPNVSDQTFREMYGDMIHSLGRSSCGGTLKPAVAFSMVSGTVDPEFVRIGQEHNIPILQGARNTFAALSAAAESARWRKWLAPADEIAGRVPEGLIESVREAPGQILSERAFMAVLKSCDLRVPEQALARSDDDAAELFKALGLQNAALKIDSADIPHKSSVGGVVLGVTSPDEARRAYDQIMAAALRAVPDARIDGVLVQAMAEGGTDVFVGCTVEPGVGPVLALGVGGVDVEALNLVSTAMCPLGPDEAAHFVKSSPAAAMLRSRSGNEPGDLVALTEVVRRLSHVAWWLRDEVVEFDVNPVRVFAVGEGVMLLDALAVKRSTDQTSGNDFQSPAL